MARNGPNRTRVRSRIESLGLRRDRFNNIDTWVSLGLEPKGTRSKSILQQRNSNKKFLFKRPQNKLEIATEVFNSILANELGIHHVEYFPATYQGDEGVVCPRFFDPAIRVEELWEMRELLLRYSTRLQQLGGGNFGNLFGRDELVMKEHSIENIYLILNEEFGRPVLEAFFRMVGFDALIGHTDRHWENYGVLVYLHEGELKFRFSPVYDTATAFSIGTRDEAIDSLLKRLQDPKWYRPKNDNVCKIKVPHDIKCNHFDLLEYLLSSPEMSRYKHCFAQAFENFHPKIAEEIFRRFFRYLDRRRAQVFLEILTHRWRIGLEIIGRL